MDEPVTDVVFVSSKDNCPKGYQIVENCPCGHEAQMWEKVLGGQSGERYLCFSKEEKDEMVIEDMYIPGKSAQYLYKGYKIVKETVEGDEPMYHKQLAVKKVPRTHATKVIADIIICRSRDNVSKMYKKLDKVNGLCICFRQVNVGGRNTPSPKPTRRATTSSAPPSPSSSITRGQRGGSFKIEDVARHMQGVTLNDGGTPRLSSSSSAIYRTVSPLASSVRRSPSPSPQPPSPTRAGVRGGLASFSPSPPPPSVTYDVTASAPPPPPPPSNLPPSTPNYPTAYSTNYSTPTAPPNTQTSTQPYPPPPTAVPSYPPTYPPQQATYPPTYPPQQATYPPPQPQGGYGVGGLGFGGLTGGVQPLPPSGGYPPRGPPVGPPGGYGGYGAVAGPSFTGAPTAPLNPSSGPVPYNPYQSQQGQSSYPPSGPRPPPTTPRPSYGFNF